MPIVQRGGLRPEYSPGLITRRGLKEGGREAHRKERPGLKPHVGSGVGGHGFRFLVSFRSEVGHPKPAAWGLWGEFQAFKSLENFT